MEPGRGNAPLYPTRMPTRPTEIPQREEMTTVYEPQNKEFEFPQWTPVRGRHVDEQFSSRGYRTAPPPNFYHEKVENRYHEGGGPYMEQQHQHQQPWRPRTRKRRGSVPPGLDRPRNSRPFIPNSDEQQREAAEVRVRQQLQGITVLKDLCSKESYQKYLKHSSKAAPCGCTTSIPADDIHLPDFNSDLPEDIMERDGTEKLEELKDFIKTLEKQRKGENYAQTQKVSLLLNKQHAEVLRLYYPTT